MKSVNVYSPPLEKGGILEVKSGESGSPGHRDWRPRYGDERQAVDFYCPAGTQILAALDGVVKWVKDDSDEGGPDERFIESANMIGVLHENGEYSRYTHLERGSCLVSVGDTVTRGQPIAVVGRTGYIPPEGYHLDFAVLKFTGPDKNKDYVTVRPQFSDFSLE